LDNYNTSVEGIISNSGSYAFASELSGYVSSADNKNYLIISNASGDTQQYCLELNPSYDALAGKYIVIDSVGRYGPSIVSLAASKVNLLPSYLVYGTLN